MNTKTEYLHEMEHLAGLCSENCRIDSSLYEKYHVKKGLRDINGKGVLAGLTNISLIEAYKEENGVSVPCEGKLLYRGINIYDLVNGLIREKRLGFEETTYLLLFGRLPSQAELDSFKEVLAKSMT